MPLLVSVLVVVGDVLVLVLEGAPAVKVVPEVVELLHVLLRALVVAEPRDGLRLAEAAFGYEDGVPEFEEVALLGLLFGGRFNVGGFVDGVELTAFDGVEEDFGGFLYAFEKGVVLGRASGCFFVWVMAKDFFAVRAFDLGFCSFEAVIGEAEDGVMVLVLVYE